MQRYDVERRPYRYMWGGFDERHLNANFYTDMGNRTSKTSSKITLSTRRREGSSTPVRNLGSDVRSYICLPGHGIARYWSHISARFSAINSRKGNIVMLGTYHTPPARSFMSDASSLLPKAFSSMQIRAQHILASTI